MIQYKTPQERTEFIRRCKEVLKMVDTKSIDRGGCVELNFNESKEAKVNGDAIQELDKLPEQLPSLADDKLAFASGLDVLQPFSRQPQDTGTMKAKIKLISRPRIICEKSGQDPVTFETRYLTCSVLFESGGMTIPAYPLVGSDLVRSFWTHRGDHYLWTVLGKPLILCNSFIFLVLDAQPHSRVFEADYSKPTQANVELDILKHYSGKRVKVTAVIDEIGKRFNGSNVTYHMIRRALAAVSDAASNGDDGKKEWNVRSFSPKENREQRMKTAKEMLDEAKANVPNAGASLIK